ncbi:hypothetical protein [Streptomyces hydrogenans]|uniref:hypothetical protein n=1 Tax=Streptomyces hydrogenans TaxID=1873719 RepID=UPI003D71D1C0
MTAPAAAAIPEPGVIQLPRPVFGDAGGWAAVMERAGNCCECTGQCGATHRKTDGRCDHQHGGYGGKGAPPIRLEVAPEDPTMPEHEAARVTLDQLRAWCPGCRAGAAKKAKPPRKRSAPPQEEALF